MMAADPTTAALVAMAMYAGHHVGDFWVQSDAQAQRKGECSHAGRCACAGHVASLTATQAVFVGLALIATATAVDPVAAVLGLAVNAVSHYWADRRATLRGLVWAVNQVTAKVSFYKGMPTAHMHLDQAWHVAWLVPAALIIAAPAAGALVGTAAAAAVLGACAVASRYGRRLEAAADTESV
jgi:hypothetical protein